MWSISGFKNVTTNCAAAGASRTAESCRSNIRRELISHGHACRREALRYRARHMRREVEIVNELGLHARPAAEFVRCVQKFECEITIRKGEDHFSAGSILE